MRIYAGIGNRKIPSLTTKELALIAEGLARLDWHLRSGGADGVDKAFQAGAERCPLLTDNTPSYTVLRPEHASPEAMEIAAQYHPAWNACTPFAKKLLGRNVQILLGLNLDQPAEFVLAWTVNEDRGGTAFGLRVARAYDIPAYNLFDMRPVPVY